MGGGNLLNFLHYINKIKDKIGNPQKKDVINNFNDDEEKEYNNNLDDENNINNYENIIDLIIIYTFFIDKFKFLNHLEIIIPDSFKIEIEKNLNKQKINIDTPHPLKFFFSINNLNFLKIEFNALGSFTFDNIFVILNILY